MDSISDAIGYSNSRPRPFARKRGDVYPMFRPVIGKLMENSTPEPGKLITECYNLQRYRPSLEYQGLIERIKKEFRDCGLQW